MEKKKSIFSVRTILSILTLFLVAFVVYENWPDIVDTFYHLNEANPYVLLLLVPEQIFMYYACGQIFFSYLEKKNRKKFDGREKLLISTELNFVNHAVPAGGLGGIAYLTYRLKEFDVSAGQASFLYLFRYAVTTVVNYLQALISIIILAALKLVPDSANWIIWAAFLMNFGVAAAIGFVVFVASSKKRIDFFAKVVGKVTDSIMKVVTFGRKKHMVDPAKFQKYFLDIHECVVIIKKDKKSLIMPTVWGLIYSFLEIATYWLVAISLGRPELLPFIMVGEAIGSVFDGIVPYGLYELGMAGVMIALGVDFSTTTIVTVMTRVITLVFTIVTGSWPYYQAIQGHRETNER